MREEEAVQYLLDHEAGEGMRRRSKKPPVYRLFCCPVCCETITIPKRRKTAVGHVKTMWCWRCRTVRDFIQIS
jgi:hypothetical protein